MSETTPYEEHPADAPVAGVDPGDDRQVIPGLDTGDPGTSGTAGSGTADPTDTGGPDTQLAADKD